MSKHPDSIESRRQEMSSVDRSQDRSGKAPMPGPVGILISYSKTTRWGQQTRLYRSIGGSQQVVKGNDQLL